MKIAVVGATGLVGAKMLEILAERNFPVSELIPVASEKSVGKTVSFRGAACTVVSNADAVAMKPDIALFSAGGGTSLEWAPIYADAGTIVIDNSSAWRMNDNIKLIVPEINGSILRSTDRIIANPNCSTIQMVLALFKIHRQYQIKRIVVSTYQSVTGTGKKAVTQLFNERSGIAGERAYKYPIDLNVIPQIDNFLENGYTKEEMKMVNETHKILNDYSIGISATTVRIPVVGGHSESVNVELAAPFEMDDLIALLNATPGVIVEDNPASQMYPMPLTAAGKDAVFVGRIRRDDSIPNAFNMWIVSDNLRKGAATNAIQIAEYIVQHILHK